MPLVCMSNSLQPATLFLHVCMYYPHINFIFTWQWYCIYLLHKIHLSSCYTMAIYEELKRLIRGSLKYYIIYSMVAWVLDHQLNPEGPDQISSGNSYPQNLQIGSYSIVNVNSIHRKDSHKILLFYWSNILSKLVIICFPTIPWHVGMLLNVQLKSFQWVIWMLVMYCVQAMDYKRMIGFMGNRQIEFLPLHDLVAYGLNYEIMMCNLRLGIQLLISWAITCIFVCY